MQSYNIFNTANSLEEALNAIKQSVPLHMRNEITALVMAYHNTLLKELHHEAKN